MRELLVGDKVLDHQMSDDVGSIEAIPWPNGPPPRRLLAIRMHAMGDVAITLPYICAVQRLLPDTLIDFVTLGQNRDLPRALRILRHVDGLGGGRRERWQLLMAPLLLARLLTRRYDVVLDLQNNRVSRTIRRAVAPRAWASFDRYSPLSAGERTRRTIAAAGFSLARVEAALPLRDPDAGLAILQNAGWDRSSELVILSPAGAFPSRNWPLERYAEFATRWQRGRTAQFAVLGLANLHRKAIARKAALGSRLLDLAGRTSPSEALAIVQRAALVLTEDCGLMHLAWISGVPTLALFGSSQHVWSTPLGQHTVCLHSGDLACGGCMDRTCRYGDVHCLNRYTADYVVERALALVERSSRLATKII